MVSRRTQEIDRTQGCLLGQLAGDALGGLVEFQSPDEIRRGSLFGPGCTKMRGRVNG